MSDTQERLDEIVTPCAYGFDQYHNSSCPECMFNFAEARQELTKLIESAKREGAIEELQMIPKEGYYGDEGTAVEYVKNRIAQLKQSEESI